MAARKPDGDLEITMFPFTPYNGWDWPSYPCFMEDPAMQLDRIRNFECRKDDILLCTSQKSGTHWIHEVVCMLVDHTFEYNSRDATFKIHLDFTTDFTFIENETRRRIIHTHFPYSCIPQKHKELGGKIIYMNRNPKDRHVSQYCFWTNLRGFPNPFKWNDYFNNHVRNDMFYGGWWNYTKQFEEAMKSNNNILSVTYEKLKLHPIDEMQRIVKFLEVPVEVDFLQQVADKIAFNKLKDKKLDATVAVARDSKSTLFRKGQIGDWKNYFTVAQNEEFDEMYRKEMNGFDVEFIYENP